MNINFETIRKELGPLFERQEEIENNRLQSILQAFHEVRLAATDFYWPTGYGYADAGREKVEHIYAQIFGAEDAIVRPNLVSGTHALFLTLNALLQQGDHLISANGDPYDTLQKCIGITGNESGNLKEKGVAYDSVNLLPDGNFDMDALRATINKKTKLIIIQRSRGYSVRAALHISKIEHCIKEIKGAYPHIIMMVDNCYGEFVEELEPSHVGADITVGSLIKNPGGGLAITGGYIVGKRKLISLIANQLTAPGIGKECGLSFGTTRLTLQGLFNAPHVVSQALKTVQLFSYVLAQKNILTIPQYHDPRTDIVQIFKMKDEMQLIKFCNAIQQMSPVDAHVTLEPWEMPGYEHKIIMASGSFVQGSSIEISADAPLVSPYYVYMQGAMSYAHGKLVLAHVLKQKIFDL